MTAREKLSETLQTAGAMCDDCLSSSAAIKPRQTVNQRCRELERQGELTRSRDLCPRCRTHKIVNRLKSEGKIRAIFRRAKSKPNSSEPPPDLLDKPWYWEGNVQARIVDHLQRNGWKIVSSADTALREAGKDIVATKGGKELWVSVKGYPERSSNTQARHWFSHALFDVVLYRDQNPEVRLAIGLPDGFSTYQNLIPRVSWLRQNLPLEVMMVSEAGKVTVC